MTRRVYMGPRGELERKVFGEMKVGRAYRLPSYPEDRQRREVLERLLQRRLVERVPGQPHLVRRRPRDAYTRLSCHQEAAE